MHLSVCIQDPTDTGTTYLYEAILSAAAKASHWRGLFAFATRDGVNHLFDDKVVRDLFDRGGEVDLIVGVDAVTNRATLERMQELERHHVNFRPRVFWNENPGLFHPKLSDFALSDGGRILIIGSGNLTPGGLRRNFEAYTVVTANRDDDLDASALEQFLHRHLDDIRTIDDEVLNRAAANVMRPLRTGRRRARAPVRRPIRTPTARRQPILPGRVLLAHVPRAGGRWAQVHFNAHVIQHYFRLHPNRLDTQRVYLTHVRPDASRGDVEVRPCVFSQTNKNYKIEVGAASHLAYPQGDRPLLIFRERQLRTYDYMLLMPGADGYAALLELSHRLPSPGRGLPRAVTQAAEIAQTWPECPLLRTAQTDYEDV